MWVVSFAAVFWDVTQRSPQSSRFFGGALRDIPKNGCEGDYHVGRFYVKQLIFKM